MEEKKQNIITINGVDYTLKPGMKAIIIFEKLTDKAFSIKTTTDIITYIYSAMLAGTPGMKLGFDELLDAFDENPTLMQQCTDLLLPRTAMDKVMELSHDDEGGGEPKKE